GVPAAGAGQARPAAAAALGLAALGRAQDPQADGADAVRLVGGPAQSAAQYRAGLVPDRRQRELAVSDRPPARVPAGHVSASPSAR
ncbi:hypothetical protein CATMIT_01960, partial [Catenibacterium mitsuokai DSM 15897]